MKRKLLRVLTFALALCLILGMTLPAAAGGDPEAKFIITISPPATGQTGTAFVTIRLEDVNGTGFMQAEAKLGEDGSWQDITESLRANGWAQLEITQSGKVYVSVTDHAGKAHIQSLYVEWFGGSASAAQEQPTAPAPTAPTEAPAAPVPSSPSPMPTDGSGTVTENSVKTPGEREFYTIQSDKGNDYYIIVDKEKDNQNVYLLSTVTEDDLLGLTPQQPTIPTEPETEPPTEPETEPPTEAETTPAPEKEGSAGAIVLIVIVMLVCGGAAYYFKIVRPKQDSVPEDDYAEDDDPDDDLDEYEYADDEKEE
jgi:hypothetical protein